MTELSMGLIALGVAFVIGIFVYNKWQELRYRKLAEKVLQAEHDDVLLNAMKEAPKNEETQESDSREDRFDEDDPEPLLTIEPSSNDWQDEEAAQGSSDNSRIEPVIRFDDLPEVKQEPRLSTEVTESIDQAAPVIDQGIEQKTIEVPAPVETKQEPPSEVKKPAEPTHLLSERVDYIASIDLIESTPANQLLDSNAEVLSRLRKPVLWVGYNENTREWEKLSVGSSLACRSYRAALQLVDRQGAVQESDLSAFHLVMQDLAAQLMAVVNMPPKHEALDRAIKLDEFCASVDIQIGVNVVSQGVAFPGTKIRALAEAAGMSIDQEGRLVRHDDDGNVLFAILNREIAGFTAESIKTMTTHGVTFLLDVPKVHQGERVFNQMLELALRFADVLRGVLVDDNKRPLSDSTLEPIRKQIGHYQTMMQEQGLPAGKPMTIRLFS